MSKVLPGRENREHAHRHAVHALDDFELLRIRAAPISELDSELLHSISHHLRHVVYRLGKEVTWEQRARYDAR